MKQLPNVLLQSLKIEYETTPISIEELCTKHKIHKEQIPSTWVKNSEEAPKTTLVIQSSTTPSISEDEVEDDDEHQEIKDSINQTARSLISEVNTIILSGDLTPKDLKDIAATLISIKESVLGKDPTVKIDVTNNTQINLLQNIVSQVKSAKRDC